MAIKIAYANVKGGCAKSTSAICTAQELKSRGYRVLFVDCDGQKNGSKFYGIDTDEGIATVVDILCGDTPMSQCIIKTENGDIIPSDIQVFDCETMVKNNEKRFIHFKMSVKSVEDLYDFIIFDTAPSIGVTLKNVLGCTDYVIIPVKDDGWSVEGLIPFYEQIEMARYNNPNLKVLGILTTMHDSRTKRKNARMDEAIKLICETYQTNPFGIKIRQASVITEALTEFRMPLHEYAKNSKAHLDYVYLVDEILERIGGNK